MQPTPRAATPRPGPRGPVERAAFIALVGRPNVGKSTLLNQILGEKLAIVSPRPQTTRDRLLAVRQVGDAQLALVDTPGLHRVEDHPRVRLNRFMVDQALRAIADVDLVVFMTDIRSPAREPGAAAGPRGLHPGDRFVLEHIKAAGKRVFMAINKVDLLKDKRLLLPLIETFSGLHDFAAIVPLSARTGAGVDRLLGELRAACPQGPALFPADTLTDRAERWLAGELIREQVFLATRREVPYGVAVTIEEWQERARGRGSGRGQRQVALGATIHVEKATQKKILVGARGQMVRHIGIAARQEIARLLGCPVHLSLFVRVDEAWSESEAGLRSMGYGGGPDEARGRTPSSRRRSP